MSKKERMAYRRECQAVFQDPYAIFNPFYRADHVFNMAVSGFQLARGRAEARRMIEEALEVVGLRPEEILRKYPHQLSGGQRQRIIVARAFMLKPRLIVADEPVSMIDASLRAQILEIMLKLKEDFGISFLFITHDLSTAYQISDRIFILYRGSVAETGDATGVINDPHALDQTVRIDVADTEHPITATLEPWDIVDETYHADDADEDSHILLTTDHL